MKQDEEEWKEYRKVMEDVIEKSGLDKKIFYDLKGNHDSFGVPVVGGTSDFFHKYSINAGIGRTGNVHSVTLVVSSSLYLIIPMFALKRLLHKWYLKLLALKNNQDFHCEPFSLLFHFLWNSFISKFSNFYRGSKHNH